MPREQEPLGKKKKKVYTYEHISDKGKLNTSEK